MTMRDVTNVGGLAAGAVRGVAALALALSVVGMAGCGSGGSSGAAPQDEAQAPADAGEEATDSSATEEGQALADDAALDVWTDECLDRHGGATVYALSELDGSQLQGLLQQQEYEWDERNQLWMKANGTSVVCVYDVGGETLSTDEIAGLQAGAGEATASYRIVSNRYASAERAFEALVANVLTCEDSQITPEGGVAVVSGPSHVRSLVYLDAQEGGISVTMVGEDALAEGAFDAIAGRKVGSTLESAFKRLCGRRLGSEQPEQ